MRALILTVVMSAMWVDAAFCERLDKSFGPERERGYRSEREFGSKDTEFKNRDRANFLGIAQPDRQRPELPRTDLHAPVPIGVQR